MIAYKESRFNTLRSKRLHPRCILKKLTLKGRKVPTLRHPRPPYRVPPLPVSKGGENAHYIGHSRLHASQFTLRVTWRHALARRLRCPSSSQAHLDFRYRLIQGPGIDTLVGKLHKVEVNSETEEARLRRYSMTWRVCDTWLNADLERSEPACNLQCTSMGT
jgi:hypothetical protein